MGLLRASMSAVEQCESPESAPAGHSGEMRPDARAQLSTRPRHVLSDDGRYNCGPVYIQPCTALDQWLNHACSPPPPLWTLALRNSTGTTLVISMQPCRGICRPSYHSSNAQGVQRTIRGPHHREPTSLPIGDQATKVMDRPLLASAHFHNRATPAHFHHAG